MSREALDLVTVAQNPFNAETPIEALAEPITPARLFYVRNHFEVPAIDARSWRLRVEGLVRRPREFSLPELRELPNRTLAVTLECAGNGRSEMKPRPSGTPWKLGAVGTARFTGTPLAELLEETGPNPSAVDVVFTGADQGEVEPGRVEPFGRALSLEEALGSEALLAWEMNGEPLSPDHGFPLRLVVPRRYGVDSVKWLTSISVAAEAFEGYYQRAQYRYEGDPKAANGEPVGFMRVRAIIGRPAAGERLRVGPVEIAGTAWSGHGAIDRVEVSVDAGASWSDAELGSPPSPHAATPWRLRWAAESPGEHVLAARATDSAGNTQPWESIWNAYGYGNNVVHRVPVTIDADGP